MAVLAGVCKSSGSGGVASESGPSNFWGLGAAPEAKLFESLGSRANLGGRKRIWARNSCTKATAITARAHLVTGVRRVGERTFPPMVQTGS